MRSVRLPYEWEGLLVRGLRELRIGRCGRVEDRQRAFYPTSSFHEACDVSSQPRRAAGQTGGMMQPET